MMHNRGYCSLKSIKVQYITLFVGRIFCCYTGQKLRFMEIIAKDHVILYKVFIHPYSSYRSIYLNN